MPGESFIETLGQALAESRISVSDACLRGMAAHFALVEETNREFNLTAIVEPREAAAKHFCDSLSVLAAMEGLPEAGRGADVGSGAGFPGIPLALARPGWRWALIEAKRKKVEFLKRAVAALELENVEVEWGRSEDLARAAPWRDGFDLAVGRAIALLAPQAEMLLPLVRPGGLAVAMKGPAERWPPKAEKALARMGAGGMGKLEYELPWGMGRRTLVLIGKAAPTPRGFPRNAGAAAKEPLF